MAPERLYGGERVGAEGRAEAEMARAHRDERFQSGDEFLRGTDDADPQHLLGDEGARLRGVTFRHDRALDGRELRLRHAETVEDERAQSRAVIGDLVAQ